MKDVVILDGARTAIGTFGGSLAGTPPSELATAVAREAMVRSGVEPGQIGASVFGHVINTEAKDMYMGRVAAVNAGVPEEATGLTVNRLCGSGAQAIVNAAQHIMLGDVDYALAGGAESMSRSPHITQSIRTGQKMGDVSFSDMMIGALSDPFGVGHMGVTAENVAAENQITREQQDAFAVESQRRAAAAVEAGYFEKPDLAHRGQGQARNGPVCHRRTHQGRHDHGKPRKASPGLQEGRFGDGRKRFGHQ